MSDTDTPTLGDPAHDRDAITAVAAALESSGLTKSGVAKAMGVSPAKLGEWLRGKYAGDVADMNARATLWLEAREQRAAVSAGMPGERPWYPTPTADRILTRLQLAHYGPDIAVVDGAAGVGKTVTARHYQASHANVWLATMAPDCAGVLPALEEIAHAMGLEVQGGAAVHRRAIVRRLRDTGDSGALIVVDEAQHLGTSAFDEIRTLHDRAGCGIAYLGNKGVWAQLVGGGRRGEALDRVHSRIGARVHCRGASVEDVRAMLDAWEISDRGARSAVLDIAKRPGALRAATKAIRTAALFAQGEPITADHVRAAAAERGV